MPSHVRKWETYSIRLIHARMCIYTCIKCVHTEGCAVWSDFLFLPEPCAHPALVPSVNLPAVLERGCYAERRRLRAQGLRCCSRKSLHSLLTCIGNTKPYSHPLKLSLPYGFRSSWIERVGSNLSKNPALSLCRMLMKILHSYLFKCV